MKKIDIILPNRIGDAILSLPLLVCLKQLMEKYNKDQKITIFPLTLLFEIFDSFDLFEVKKLNYLTKLQSWITPADIAFFIMTTSQNLGYTAKKTYGEVVSHKKLIKYDVDTKYLDFNYAKNNLPQELQDFLRDKYKLASCSIRYFGFCYDLGYTTEQIISTFKFDTDCLNIKKAFSNFDLSFINSDYLVFCMEAAYGRKNDSDRRWDSINYFEIAEKIFEKHNIKSVFVGIDNTIPVLNKPYFIDLRKKITLADTAKLLLSSKGYVGNDTGPLHLANLMKKNSVGVYFREGSTIDYTPIFADLNKIVLCPQSIDEVFQYIDELLLF